MTNLDPDHDNFQDSAIEVLKLLQNEDTPEADKNQLQQQLRYDYSRAYDISIEDPHFEDHFTAWKEHALKSL